ncbi:MAG TPA: PBSX family phage terminase large subunit, partial [Candidatus Nitrosocosmicus sp.]|nr:PBSX family phage terminase large subunit [Candidatus Nitrosocosmicus sp.]
MNQIQIDKSVFSETFFPLLQSTVRLEILYGGGGAGKSYFLGQRDIVRLLKGQQENILVLRKVAADNHNSTFSDHQSIIYKWNLSNLFRINRSVGSERITCVNGNEIIYAGCKDESELEKLKGIRGTNGPITKLRLEEATQFTARDFHQLNNIRLRGNTREFKQCTLSFNPVTYGDWIKKMFFEQPKDKTLFCEHREIDIEKANSSEILIHKSTHIDNDFYGEEERKELLKLQFTDEYYYKVYVLGEWGVLSGVVFSNYVVEDFDYTENDLENVSNGLDFGFVHNQAFIRCGFKDGKLYIFDEVYSSGIVNSEHMKLVYDKYGSDSLNWEITADSASPDKIQEWEDFGYSFIKGAIKGKDSLNFGIEYLIGMEIHIHATNCPNIAN